MGQPTLVSGPASNFPSKPLEPISLQTIADYASGILRQGEPQREISGITTDSRRDGNGELFLALRGENFDGHHFVADSAARGTAGAVVERGWISAALPPDYALIEVEDTLLAYQRIAAAYRRTLVAKVVAITGSNGKTSTKDFTASILARKFRVLKTEGNLNNHIGVPQTILGASADDEVIVLEMGMNHPGEIAPLVEMAMPHVGIVTNIGTAHIEFMGSRAGIAREKGMLAEAIGSDGYVILPALDDYSAAIAARTSARVLLVGGEKADIRAEAVEQEFRGTRFDLIAGGETQRVYLPVPGRHMVTNALLAVAAGLVCGVPLADCVTGLCDIQLTKGRMELKTVAGLQILDDSYNANPESMVAALETLARMPTMRRRVAVLGKMGELGETSEARHRQVGEAAARAQIDQLIGVGPEAEEIVQAAQDAGLQDAVAVTGTEQAAEILCASARQGDLILIKGSRSAAMERILAALSQALAIPLLHRPFASLTPETPLNVS